MEIRNKTGTTKPKLKETYLKLFQSKFLHVAG